MHRRIVIWTLIGFLSLSSLAWGQAAPTGSQQIAVAVDSGFLEVPATAKGPEVVFSTIVHRVDAVWMRLRFDTVLLSGSGSSQSYLRMTSEGDGATQHLDHEHLGYWNNTSAYFNGNAVLVELIVYPGTGPSRVVIGTSTAGFAGLATSRSICGETDDRVPSNDPRVARVEPVGCSAFLVDRGDCANVYLTAGHCPLSLTQVAQFNVPASLPDGTIQHPAPRHQYPVIPDSRAAVYQGLGQDYGAFATAPNSETGLDARNAQGAAFTLAATAPPFGFLPGGVQVTGYGIDDGEAYAVQQTHIGGWVGRNGFQIRHRADTEPGSSGSPVIDVETDTVVGIHTEGGCDSPVVGLNSGTAIDNPGIAGLLDGIVASGYCAETFRCFARPSWIPPWATDWSDAVAFDAQWDGANCYVAHLGQTDGEPFIYRNHYYYVTPGPNGECEQGWFDGANCLLGWAPRFRQPFYWGGAFYYEE